MPRITIAEALAQIGTITRQIDARQRLITTYLLREQRYRDPLRSLGGSAAVLARELTAVQALHERRVLLRRQIHHAYESTPVTFGERTRSLADWLTWRREVSARRAVFLDKLTRRITGARRQAERAARLKDPTGQEKSGDIVVHFNEQELAAQREELEEVLGHLDGQLALKNATLTIEVPPDDACKTGLEEQLDELVRLAGAAPTVAVELGHPWSQSPELCRLARQPMYKIAAIKLYRELTGCGLKEAKDAVEAFSGTGG